MSSVVRVYGWLAKVQASRRESRISGLVSGVMIIVFVSALGELWTAAANGQLLEGYSAAMLVWYVTIGETAIGAVDNQLLLRVGQRIRDGEIATMLTRPIHPGFYLAAEEAGASIARSVSLLAFGAATAWAIAGPPPSVAAFTTIVVTVPLAIVLQVVVVTMLGAATFWLGDSRAIWFLHMKVIFLLGGMLIPLELCPPAVEHVARVLPWAGMAWIPAHLGVGAVDLAQLPVLVAAQLAWIALGCALLALVFARGQKRMAVAG